MTLRKQLIYPTAKTKPDAVVEKNNFFEEFGDMTRIVFLIRDRVPKFRLGGGED